MYVRWIIGSLPRIGVLDVGFYVHNSQQMVVIIQIVCNNPKINPHCYHRSYSQNVFLKSLSPPMIATVVQGNFTLSCYCITALSLIVPKQLF